MPPLTIRNVTITPLQLVKTVRNGADPNKSGSGGGGGSGGITRTITGLFVAHPTTTTTPQEQETNTDVCIAPFETRLTDIRAPDPLHTNTSTHETLRLTFTAAGGPHRYEVTCPVAGDRRTVVMTPTDEPPDAPLELTAVYTPGAAQLTVLSSAQLARWMGALRDELPLSALSIPGTHNSPTCFVALPSVRCQAVGVRAQLDNGVRFLDVRVSVARSSDHLALVHSVFPVALTGARYLAALLDECYAFLDANPREALLMSVKREGTGRGSDQQLGRWLFARYCGGDDAARWFTEPRIPSLGEARGKIVLIRRFHIDEAQQAEHDGKGWGIDASAWPDNCADDMTDSGLIRLQDFYEVGHAGNIDKKADMAKAHLERACQQVCHDFASPPPFFINFLTASNFFNSSCWPERVAARLNPAIVEYLCTKHAEKGKGPAQLDVGDAGTGIVVTDWVGQGGDWDLVRCIVAWNARLQLER